MTAPASRLKMSYLLTLLDVPYVLRDESGTYRVDGAGLVYTAAGRTFVSNVMDTDWLVYTVITDEASYDVTLQVL